MGDKFLQEIGGPGHPSEWTISRFPRVPSRIVLLSKDEGRRMKDESKMLGFCSRHAPRSPRARRNSCHATECFAVNCDINVLPRSFLSIQKQQGLDTVGRAIGSGVPLLVAE
jgi:hypothetical protein